MKRIFNWKEKVNEIELEKISKDLRIGKVAIFPTETVYGIGANVVDESAVKKIYKIKNRPRNKAINVLVSDIKMVWSVAKDILPLEERIIEEFFPGPLTIILKKNDNVPSVVTAGGETIGVRMPANDIALKIIDKAGIPLATTSANLSGEDSAINMKMLKEKFMPEEVLVIDGGESKIGVASTIIQVENENIKIIRQGSITKEEIEEKINRK